MNKFKIWSKFFFINLLILILIGIIIEGLIRAFNPQITPVSTDRSLIKEDVYYNSSGLNPNSSGKSMGVTFKVTEKGFWFINSNTASSKKWLLLGDSVTMGMGVDPDSTYASRLSEIQDSLEIFNSSLIGYASHDYLNISQNLIAKTSYDIERITLFWCLNDVYGGENIGSAPGGFRVLTPKIMSFIRDNIYTYQWLKKTFFNRPKSYYQHDRSFYLANNKNYIRSLSYLERIAELSDSLNIKFEVVILPYQYQLSSKDQTPQKIFTSSLDSMNIQYIDLYEDVEREKPYVELYHYGDGIHFSKIGHKKVFEGLKKYL